MIPDFRILADRKDVTEHIRSNLVSLTLTDKSGGDADQVEIVIADPENRIALPRRGAVLQVSLGWSGEALVDKGSYTVDEVGEEGPLDCITITARSADFRKAAKNARDESFHDTTLGDILKTVAERNGLTPAIHPQLAAKPVAHIDQTTESDVNLVTRLGKDYGATAAIKNGKLIFTPRGSGQTGSGSVLPTVTIRRNQGDRHTFRDSDRDGEQSGVKAKWHDYETGETKEALAGADGSVNTLKRLYPTQAEAQAAADGHWQQQQAGSQEFTVTLAVGRADIIAGSPLALDGWRHEIVSCRWIIDQLTHSLDGGGGFTTAVKASVDTGASGGGESDQKDDLKWVDAVKEF